MSGPTREQVRAWAEQSGVCWVSPTSGALFPAVREDCEMAEEVERLVSLAYAAGQAAEREACAKVCEKHRKRTKGSLSAGSVTQWAANECAAAIRARGQQ